MDGDNTQKTTPTLERIAHLLADKSARVTQADIARESGLSGSAISQWLKGSYPGDMDAVERKLLQWLDARSAKTVAGNFLTDAPAWVETPTAMRVLANLRHAQLLGDISIVYGGAGVGKTTAIERYQSICPNVWVATMTPAHKSVVTCLQQIAAAMDLKGINGAAALFDAIIKRVSKTNGLIVLDEAQHLCVEALDQVRAINDATKVGIALVGNEQVYARMSAGQRQASYLDRLHSRVGKRTGIKKTTLGDVDALIEYWGLSEGKCREELHSIAQRPGALRIVTKVLRMAAMYAGMQGQALCCTHISEAWKELGAVE